MTSRTVVVSPRSTNDCPSAIDEKDLIRAFGTVLAWANFEEIRGVSFTPAETPSFSFRYSDGTVGNVCKNVSEPPDDLKPVMCRSILWAISRNRFAYWVNRFWIRFFRGSWYARLLILSAEGDSTWGIEVNSAQIVTENLTFQPDNKCQAH